MNILRFASRFLIVFALAIPAAHAQTPQTYNTVASIAALKAMTNRPQVIEVVDANPGIFNLSTGACSAADDIFQVQPTSGTTVCYTRMAGSYAIGKNANLTVQSIGVGGAAVWQTGPQSGYQSTWDYNLLETNPGDIADVSWTANSSGIQTSGIWNGNSSNFFGVSQRMDRASDPPNITRSTNALTTSGSAVLNFADTTGVTIGDYVNGSANIPSSATVQSKTSTTVTLTAPTTGNVTSGTALSFVSPYMTGTWVARGNRNALFTYARANGTVKPVNGIMTLGQCDTVNAYCSGANIIALTSITGSTKLVAAELDQVFQPGTTAAAVGAGSAGLVINTFNGSTHNQTGNGPGILLGSVDGYWTDGFICGAIVTNGSCFGVNTGSASMASMADSLNGTFNVGAYLLGNDTGANNQRIVFRATSGANAAIFMDSSNVLNVSAVGRIVNFNLTTFRASSPDERVASIVSTNASGYSIARIENSTVGTAFDYGVDNNGGGFMRSLATIAAGTSAWSLLNNGTPILNVTGNGNIVGTGTITGVTNVTASGTIRANTGFSANGTAGVSKTVTVRDSAGTGTCTLIFTTGIYTGGTC